MTLEDAIYEELLGTTGITALVGNRIYRGWRPQHAATPCLTFFRISRVPINASTGPSGTEHARIQIDVWANTSKTARAIADAVSDALAGWSSTDPVSSPMRLESDQDMPVEPDDGVGQWETRVSQDYSIWYSAS